jgi:PAS domain S-box-containing protein
MLRPLKIARTQKIEVLYPETPIAFFRMVLNDVIASKIKDILKKNPQGMNITRMYKEMDIHRNTLSRYLETLLVSGQVEMRRFGMGKIYTLSERIPLSEVLSISSELVIQLDKSLRITFANEPFLHLVGTELKHLIRKNIEYTPVALIFDESFPLFIENIRKGVAGENWAGEISLSSKDIVVFCRITPTVFDDGRRGVSVILEDITSHKKADKDLQESEHRYRKLVEISPDAVFIHQEGKIIYANPAAVRLLGALHQHEIRGKNVLDFVQPEFRDSVRNNILKDLGGDITPPMELYMSRVNGTPVIVEGRGVRTFIDGEFAIQVALRDITERKRAEELLRTKDRQLTSLFSNVPDVLFYLSVEKHGRYRFLTVNQSFLNKVHRTEDQVVGKYVHEVIPDPPYTRASEKYLQAILEKKTIEWEEVQDSPFGKRYGDCYITAIYDEHGHATHIIGSVHDSTSHKQLEEELRHSEGKLAGMLESMSDIISMVDRDLNILWVNECARRDFGSDLIGRKCYEVYHQRKTPCHPYPCSVLKAFHDGKMHQHEVTLIDKKGETRFFEGSANIALRDTAGNPVAVLETAREITDKKNAERALRESERRLRLVLDSTDDMIILQDTEGRYLYFNSAARYGVAKDDIIGLTPHYFFDKETADRLVERVKTVVKTGQALRQETLLVWKGQTLWFSDSLSPVREADGSITGVVTVSQNITERKRTEMALRESEATARALINAPTDSVILMDARGIILALNDTAASRFGRRPEELIGVLTDDILPKDLAQSRRLLVSKIFETKTMVRFEDERDGRRFDTVAYPILNEHGDVIRIAIVARDITKRE